MGEILGSGTLEQCVKSSGDLRAVMAVVGQGRGPCLAWMCVVMSGVRCRWTRGITCELGTLGIQGDSVPDSVGSLDEVECVSILRNLGGSDGTSGLCAVDSGQRGGFEIWDDI